MGDVLKRSQTLREQAERCQRLARATTDGEATHKLLEFAVELEVRPKRKQTDARHILPTIRVPALVLHRVGQSATRAASTGGGFGERGSAEGATACRNRHITETFRAFFGGRVGSNFSAPHSGENSVHRQHDEEIYGGSDQDE